MQLNALKDVMLTSSSGKVTIAAKEEILLTVGSGYIKIHDGEVEIGCPTMVRVKCAGFEVSGANSVGINMQNIPAVERYSLHFILKDAAGNILPNTPYKITDSNNQIIRGITDHKGSTQIIYSDKPDSLSCEEDWDSIFSDETNSWEEE